MMKKYLAACVGLGSASYFRNSPGTEPDTSEVRSSTEHRWMKDRNHCSVM